MKLLHFSDTHYGGSGAISRCSTTVNAMANREDIGDCVIIMTGDAIDSPFPRGDQFTQAEVALRQLAERAGGVVVLPGNHDEAIGGLVRWSNGLPLHREFERKLTGRSTTYPASMVFGDIGFIGLNTCRYPSGVAERGVDSFLARGYLGEKQIESAARLVRVHRDKERFAVIGLHHSPVGCNPTLRLSDRGYLELALSQAGGVDYMLTGHVHRRLEEHGVCGARNLLTAPKCGEPSGYWELSSEAGELNHRWCSA